MKVNVPALCMYPNNFPWYVTPFDRPSNAVPVYLYLSRYLGYYSTDYAVKGFMMGSPTWTQITNGKLQGSDLCDSVAKFCGPDGYSLGNRPNDEVVLVALSRCEPFVDTIGAKLAVMHLGGRIELPRHCMTYEPGDE